MKNFFTKKKFLFSSAILLAAIPVSLILYFSTEKPLPPSADASLNQVLNAAAPVYNKWSDNPTDASQSANNPYVKNDVSPNINIDITQTYTKNSILCRQLGIAYPNDTDVVLTVGLNNTQFQAVIIGINSAITGSLNFDNVGVVDVDPSTDYDTQGPGLIFDSTTGPNFYQLIGTQMQYSDFSRQDISNNFSSAVTGPNGLTSNNTADNLFIAGQPDKGISKYGSLVISKNEGSDYHNLYTTDPLFISANPGVTPHGSTIAQYYDPINHNINTNSSNLHLYDNLSDNNGEAYLVSDDYRYAINNNLNTKLSNDSFSLIYENKDDQTTIDIDKNRPGDGTIGTGGLYVSKTNNTSAMTTVREAEVTTADTYDDLKNSKNDRSYTNRLKYKINPGFWEFKYDVNNQYLNYSFNADNPISTKNTNVWSNLYSTGNIPSNFSDGNTYYYDTQLSKVDLPLIKNYYVNSWNNQSNFSSPLVNGFYRGNVTSNQLTAPWWYPNWDVANYTTKNYYTDNITSYNIITYQYKSMYSSIDYNWPGASKYYGEYTYSPTHKTSKFSNLKFYNGTGSQVAGLDLTSFQNPVNPSAAENQERSSQNTAGVGSGWKMYDIRRYGQWDGSNPSCRWGSWHQHYQHPFMTGDGMLNISYNIQNDSNLKVNNSLPTFFNWESRGYRFSHPFGTSNLTGLTVNGTAIKVQTSPKIRDINNIQTVSQNVYPIKAPNLTNLILPSSYFFAVANNTFWGYKVTNLVIGSTTHFSKTRPGISNEAASYFLKTEQIKNEPDVLFIHAANSQDDDSLGAASKYNYKQSTDALMIGIYFAKNIPFANCKITNLFIANKSTELSNESFKSIIQINSINHLHANSLASENLVSTNSQMQVMDGLVGVNSGLTNYRLVANVYYKFGSWSYSAKTQQEAPKMHTWEGQSLNTYHANNKIFVYWNRPGELQPTTTNYYMLYNNPLGWISESNYATYPYANTYQPKINRIFSTTNAFITNDHSSDTLYRDPYVQDGQGVGHEGDSLQIVYDSYKGGQRANNYSSDISHHANNTNVLEPAVLNNLVKLNSQTNKSAPNSYNLSSLADFTNSRTIYYFPWYESNSTYSSKVIHPNCASLLNKLPFDYQTTNNTFSTSSSATKVRVTNSTNANINVSTPKSVGTIYTAIGRYGPLSPWVNTVTNIFSIKTSPNYYDYIGLSCGKSVVEAEVIDKFIPMYGASSLGSTFGRKEYYWQTVAGGPSSQYLQTFSLPEYIVLPDASRTEIISSGWISEATWGYVSGIPNLVSISFDSSFAINTFSIQMNEYLANTLPQGLYTLNYWIKITLVGGTKKYECPIVIKWDNRSSPIVNGRVIPTSYLNYETASGTLNGFMPNFNATNPEFYLYNTLEIPADCRFIADNAFYNGATVYSNIKKVLYHGNGTSFANQLVIGKNAFKDNMPGLEEISFYNAKLVDDHAFENCYALSKISFNSSTNVDYSPSNYPNLSNSFMSFGDYAFANCTSLKYLSVRKVRKIGTYCFKDCNALQRVVLPDLVTWDPFPFSCNTSSLKDITIGSMYDIPTSQWSATEYRDLLTNTYFFNGNNSYDCTIRVPAQSYDNYVGLWNSMNFFTSDNFNISDKLMAYTRPSGVL